MALNNPPKELLDFLIRFSGFYIVAHEEPDGDAIGSQLALASFLKRRGKSVVLLSPGPWQRKEIAPYKELFQSSFPEANSPTEFAVLLLDCSSVDRAGYLSPYLKPYPLAVVDHHQPNGKLNSPIQYLEPRAPSTTLLIQKIIEAFGEEPTKEEAHFIFFGFATDTGFFRHLEVEAADSLYHVGRLAEKEITPKAIYRETFGNFSLQSRLYLAKILSTLESLFEGKLLLVHILAQDYQTFDTEHRQSDPLYQLLLSVEGCEVVAFIREEETERTSVSLRSPANLNVAQIAQSLGGGGHKNASGYITPLPYQAAKQQLLETLRPYLESLA
ncbi:MAG: bifunctional oligoribonuclease/PAP phosphatase NrnA [Spirochaetales bacterium]